MKLIDSRNDSDTMIGVHGGLNSEEMLVPLFSREVP
jgi:hypothetical protein